MPDTSWTEAKLRDLVDINPETLNTSTPPNWRFRYIDITSVTPGCVDWNTVPEMEFRFAPSRARRVVRPGDTLFCTVRPGLQAHANADWRTRDGVICSTGFAVLRPRQLNERFLFHTVFSAAFVEQVRQHEVGSSYPAVNESDLELVQLSLPVSTIEQARIAEILDTLDANIRETKAVIAKLWHLKAGLFNDLLTCGLDKQGRVRDPKERPEEFHTSQLGLIPKSWSTPTLAEIALKIQDGTHFSPKSKTGPRRYITSKNIRFGYIDFSECGWISEAEHQAIYSRCDVKKDDVLLTKDGANTGNAALNNFEEEFSLLSSVALIRGRDKSLYSAFLLCYLLSPIGQKRLKDMMSGNAITRLTLTKIKGFRIPLPPFDEQRIIATKLDAVDATLSETERARAKLSSIRLGLARDLLTGRVRVKV